MIGPLANLPRSLATIGPAPVRGNYAQSFSPFSVYHLVVALACTALVIAVCIAACRDNRKHERAVRRVWVWAIVVLQAYAAVWYLLPSHFELQESLPLHLCDLGVWVAAIALHTQRWRWRALLYFWGIGLSSQAFFTPVLDEGYASPQFWFFWLGHTQIVGSAVYDLWVLRYRPGWKDFGFAILAGVVYTLCMVGLNEVIDANYGYVGRQLPEKKTILNALPPWPWRVVVLAVIAIAVQLVATLPWVIVARLNRTAVPATDGGADSGAAS